MGRRKQPEYIEDLIIALDVESTSYYDDGAKKAIVYTWTVSVNGVVTIMRTREEIAAWFAMMVEKWGLGPMRRVVIYVHNLSFDYAFFKHMLEWSLVFANGEARNVIKAATTSGIEFRCSYALTNSSLAQVGKELGIKKMEGDLDYSKIRHSETPLTDEEIGYIKADVLIIDALIRHARKTDTYATIPMTRTSYTRRKIRAKVNADDAYVRMIRNMPLTPEVYLLSKKAYQGGYTHANAKCSNRIMTNVAACDLASSYPASVAQFTFPVSRFTPYYPKDPADFDQIINKCAALIDVTFHNIECKYNFPMISESRVQESAYITADNGRVWCAESVRMIITNVDFKLLLRNYSIEQIEVHSVHVARSGYLPKPLVESILELYGSKTKLKGVEGMEEEYKLAKADTNQVYGMMGTDPVRAEFELFEGNLHPLEINTEKALADDNESRSRFLYYPWGAWVTAASRFVLLETIMDLEDAGFEVIYCDTDSIYYTWAEGVQTVLDAANERIQARSMAALKHHGYTEAEALELQAPKDKKEVRHPIGIFEDETDKGLIREFKTLGAKRYAKVDHEGNFSITVAGLAKKAAGYVEEQGGMDFFVDGMQIDREHSGRLTHTYSDLVAENLMTDYTGRTAKVFQMGFVHLEPSDYHLGMSDDYRTFLQKFADHNLHV